MLFFAGLLGKRSSLITSLKAGVVSAAKGCAQCEFHGARIEASEAFNDPTRWPTGNSAYLLITV